MHKTKIRKALLPTNLTRWNISSIQKKKKTQLTLDISNLKRGARGLLQPIRKILQDSERSKYGIGISTGPEGTCEKFALDFC